MWSLLPKKWQLVVVLAAGFLFLRSYDAIGTLLDREPLGIWKSVTLSATAIGTVLVFIANLCWRWIWRKVPFLQSWAFPDLNGTWNGTLISTWINPETGKGIDPISTAITIRQSLFATHISLKTGESESHSKYVVLERLPEIKRFRLWYTYQNGPQAQFQYRSAPHEGVAYLEMDWDGDRSVLNGHYYTARKTTGDIAVTRA